MVFGVFFGKNKPQCVHEHSIGKGQGVKRIRPDPLAQIQHLRQLHDAQCGGEVAVLCRDVNHGL